MDGPLNTYVEKVFRELRLLFYSIAIVCHFGRNKVHFFLIFLIKVFFNPSLAALLWSTMWQFGLRLIFALAGHRSSWRLYQSCFL